MSRVWSGPVAGQPTTSSPPEGGASNLRAQAVPAHLEPVVASAVAAARGAGSRRGGGSWMTGGGADGLWIVLDKAEPGVEAAYAAVARAAPAEPVRVLLRTELSASAQMSFYGAATVGGGAGGGGNGGGTRSGRAKTPGDSLSNRQNVVVVLLVLVLSGLVVLGDSLGGGAGRALQVLAVLLLVATMIGTVRLALGPGGRWRPHPLALVGGLLVSAGLLYQAVRGLG